MYQHWFINFNKCAALMSKTNNRGNLVWGVQQPSVPSFPFFCKSTPILKNKVY